jgi:hypothetical protein
MKKLVLAFSLVVGGLAVYAQDSTSTTTPRQQQYPTTNSSSTMGQDDQDREKINSRDLPDAVKRSLEGTEYRGWLVNAAYKSKGVDGTMSGDSTSSSSTSSSSSSTSGQSGQNNQSSDSTSVSGNTSGNTSGAYGQEVYVVELKNGAQTKTVRFDKDGNKLDDGSKQDDQK